MTQLKWNFFLLKMCLELKDFHYNQMFVQLSAVGNFPIKLLRYLKNGIADVCNMNVIKIVWIIKWNLFEEGLGIGSDSRIIAVLSCHKIECTDLSFWMQLLGSLYVEVGSCDICGRLKRFLPKIQFSCSLTDAINQRTLI